MERFREYSMRGAVLSSKNTIQERCRFTNNIGNPEGTPFGVGLEGRLFYVEFLAGRVQHVGRDKSING